MNKARASITLSDFIGLAFGAVRVEDCSAADFGGVAIMTTNGFTVDLNLDQTKQLVSFMQTSIADHEKAKAPAPAPAAAKTPSYSRLSEQAQLVYRHMQRAGSISAREAMNDHGITSATLARRICDIEDEGFKIDREKKRHPITGKRFTRYSLAA